MNKQERRFFLILITTFLMGCQDKGSSHFSSAIASDPAVETTEPAPVPVSPLPESPDLNCVDTRVGYADSEVVEEVCKLTNEERATNGLKPLRLEMKLSAVAEAHAEDMVNRGYFSHTNPEGLSSFDRMKAAGISYQTAGENIAYFYKTPATVMATWMNSSGHRANILNSKYGKIGIGYYQNYWVQDFTN